MTCFRVEASELSKGLFEQSGFLVVEVELVNRVGVSFERFRMERRVDADGRFGAD